MRHKLLNSIKFVFLFAAMTLVNSFSNAAVYTAVVSGNWSSTTTWGGTAPSFDCLTDQITIPSGVTVMLDNNFTMDGVLCDLTVNGSLTSASGTDFTIVTGTVSGNGLISVGDASFGAGAVLMFTGSFTAENLTNTMLNLQITANIIVNNTLKLSGGLINIKNNGVLTLANNGTIELSGGTIANNGGTLTMGTSYNVVYSGSMTSGLELAGTGLQNVTINPGDGNSVTLSSDLTVKGTLTLTSGILDLNNRHLIIMGNVASSGTGYIKTGAMSNITLSSGSSIAGTIRFGGSANTLNNFTLAVGNGNQAKISGPVKINGVLTLTSGILVLESSTLDISGNIAGGGTSTISSTGTSNILINTPMAPTGSLIFTSGSNTVNNFTVNITNGGTVNVASDLNINGTLTFTSGRIDIANNTLSLGSSASITGHNSSSYIVTGATGSLAIALTAGNSTSTTFPVGTTTYYLPASVKLNTGSNSGIVNVGVMPNVYAHGTTGTDLSLIQHAVDATWDVRSNISSNLNMDLQLMWAAAAEVNGFNRSSCYIGHYTAGKWDMSTKAAATSAGAGMYSITRANITSNSPFAVFDNSTITGIAEVKGSAQSFDIYPNPVADKLYINNLKISGSETVYIEILNTNGQVITSLQLSNAGESIAVDQLPAGVYFIRANNTFSKFTKM